MSRLCRLEAPEYFWLGLTIYLCYTYFMIATGCKSISVALVVHRSHSQLEVGFSLESKEPRNFSPLQHTPD